EAELLEIRLELDPGDAREIVLNIRGLAVVYDVEKGTLSADGVTAPVPLTEGRLKMTVYADRTGLEIFAASGLVFMPVNINLDAANRSLSLSSDGGTANIRKLDVYELKSIWDN